MNTTGVPIRFGMWTPRDEQSFDRADKRIAQMKDLAGKSSAYLVDQLDKLDSPQPNSVDQFVKDLAPSDDERKMTLETELMFQVGRSADSAELETKKQAIGNAPHYQPSPLMAKLFTMIKSVLEMPASHKLPDQPSDVDKQKIGITTEIVMASADMFAQKQMANQLGPLAKLFGKGGMPGGGPGGMPGGVKVIRLSPKDLEGLAPGQGGQGGDFDFDLPPQGQGGQGDDNILDLLDDPKGPKGGK